MAVSRPATNPDWMMNPGSLVFKAFEEPIMKSPFAYGTSPHLVPEKILESFIDPNNIRLYRVKWVDSWLSEPHVAAVFPQLITEYWLNKPINESLDYQQPFEGSASRNNVQMQMPNTQANIESKEQRQQQASNVINENQLQPSQTHYLISNTLPQLFSSVGGNKENFQRNDEAANNAAVSTEQPHFNVGESLTLPEKLALKRDLKDAKKSGDVDSITMNQNLTLKQNEEQQVVLLLDKNLSYTANLNEEQDKMKSMNVSLENKVQPRNNTGVASTNFNLQNNIHSMISTIPLPSMEQMHALNQQITNQMRQIPITAIPIVQEKKHTPKKTPVPKVKSPSQIMKDKQPVVCEICGKTISSRKNLRIHKTVKHFKNGSFSCQVCGRNFALNRDLQRHMPLHTNERNYVCQYCGLQCKQPGHLTKHIRTHTEVMNWRCDCCFKNFRVQSDLKNHCFEEHKDIVEKNLNCSVCKEKLKLPNSVYLHSLRHSGVREFECPICKASFKLKQHMQVHMKTHEKSKVVESHECPICLKIFRSKLTCSKHSAKHKEKTAEEYQETQKHKEDRKTKIKIEKSSVEEQRKIDQSNSIDEDSEYSEEKGTKRKQKTPSKILTNEDGSSKPISKKRVKKIDYSCTECPESFKVKSLLRSHIKLYHSERTEINVRKSLGLKEEVLLINENDRNRDEHDFNAHPITARIVSVSQTSKEISTSNIEDDHNDLRLPESFSHGSSKQSSQEAAVVQALQQMEESATSVISKTDDFSI